jgi:uncharacterized protein
MAKIGREITMGVVTHDEYRAAVRSDDFTGLIRAMGTVAGTGIERQPYYQSGRISDGSLAAAYRQDWLARRAVDGPALDMVRAWWEFSSEDDPDGAHELAEVLDRWRIKPLFRRVLELSRLLGGAGIVMGIDDGRPPEEPVDLASIRAIRWLKPVDRRFLSIVMRETDPERPGMWGAPTMYTVGSRLTGTMPMVHASRVIAFYGDPVLEDETSTVDGWADSVLESRWAAISAYQSASRSITIACERFVKSTLAVPGLADLISEPDGASKLTTRLTNLRDGLATGNIALVDAELEKFQQMGMPVTGLSDLTGELRMNVAGALSEPQSRIFGQQQGTTRTGGETDERTHSANIRALQEDDCEPQLRQLCDLIVASKEGPTMGRPLRYKMTANPLTMVDAATQAETDKLNAEADKFYMEAGVLAKSEVRRARFAGRDWELDDDITERIEAEDAAEGEGAPGAAVSVESTQRPEPGSDPEAPDDPSSPMEPSRARDDARGRWDAMLPRDYGQRSDGAMCRDCAFRDVAAGGAWCGRHGAVVADAMGCDSYRMR